MKLAMLATGAATAAALACAAAPAQADQPGTNFIGLSVGYVPVYEGSREYRALRSGSLTPTPTDLMISHVADIVDLYLDAGVA